MIIETKFDIGQKVCRLKYTLIETKKRTYQWCYVEDTIRAIYTKTQFRTKTIYIFNSSSMGRIVSAEKDIFLTQAEAQTECDRRNNEHNN